MTDETDLVRSRYARRRASVPTDRYSIMAAANWQVTQERQRALFRLFKQVGIAELGALRLIEVGAGAGNNLLELLRMGFSPELMTGIELLPERAETARHVLPTALRIWADDAMSVQIAQSSVDIVYQSVVFSSLLDDEFQAKLASKMWSWLKPGGAVLWYDFVYNNPRNPDVRGVPLTRVKALFPGARMRCQKITLAPPIARLVTTVHPSMYTFLNALPILRTHVLCWIEKGVAPTVDPDHGEQKPILEQRT